ncbi:MAG TPA: carboxymuconolactone decarboxylase family protein [bacterium]|nr:carboxymuconolactone decarboxylase family protein [bacterium]HMW36654.1 carboxymuconolactone decarboxylase family protein [bacterium]HMY36440.1 carboxymuconolactone decarboxylase family protein [bacterium]HMZ03285.1 carboxymuconolactone decarboxylase family protein [bacterium]HNB09506.1 carboxymuconolactone decarboxylase family protein [bacterium]
MKTNKKKQIPKNYQNFVKDYPRVAKAYEELGDAVHHAGPLDTKTRALIKLAISAASRQEGAVHSHVRKALTAGASPEEMRHVIMLTLPTIGFPGMMAAMSWVNDIISSK